MAKIKLTKEEVKRILKIEGNLNGAIFGAYRQYLIAKKGEDVVKSIEWRLEELGLPIKLKSYSSFKMYPEAEACLVCLAILEHFDWDEEKAYDIGYDAPLHSLLTKILMKYVSVEKLLTEGPKHWKRHFDIGDMKCTKCDVEKGHAVMRLKGFKKFHPAVYTYIRGYLARLVEIATKTKGVRVEQTKSLYNNDSFDEFQIKWK